MIIRVKCNSNFLQIYLKKKCQKSDTGFNSLQIYLRFYVTVSLFMSYITLIIIVPRPFHLKQTAFGSCSVAVFQIPLS